MKLLVTLIGSLLLLAVAGFCGIGFLATFEPTDNPTQFMWFRVAYAGVGFGCLAGVFGLVLLVARK